MVELVRIFRTTGTLPVVCADEYVDPDQYHTCPPIMTESNNTDRLQDVHSPDDYV